jgi:hypothetical protein
MKTLFARFGATVAAALIAAAAGSWTLAGEASRLAFGSVKKHKFSEIAVHHADRTNHPA